MIARIDQDDTLPLDQVVHGECLSVMRSFPDNSVDSIVCDPPCGISFMNKEFDSNRGGRDKWILWLSTIMKEALRVLRPGGHCLVWSLPRTSHWTGLALEQAGFEMRDCLYHTQTQDSAMAAFEASLTETQRDALARLIDSQEAPSSITHIFGSGFPKSANIGKAIHRQLGIDREVIGKASDYSYDGAKRDASKHNDTRKVTGFAGDMRYGWDRDITASSPELQQYEQLGSALKPACENWWLCRKPLSEKTLALNVLKWHCGGLNIDKSRVPSPDGVPTFVVGGSLPRNTYEGGAAIGGGSKRTGETSTLGRFPSNVLFSHSLFCVPIGTKRVKGDGHKTQNAIERDGNLFGSHLGTAAFSRYNDEDGMETTEAWECDPSCPVLALEQQSGVRKSGGRITQDYETPTIGVTPFGRSKDFQMNPSTGTASRFFHCFTPDAPFLYCAKSSRSERNLGCEGLEEQEIRVVNNQNCKICSICSKHLPNSYKVCVCGGSLNIAEVENLPRQNTHPCVKSLSLMKYLCNLICPPDGIVLDMFFGSGSTGVAALQSGLHFIGIEQELEYVTIARARIAHAMRGET